MSEAFQEENEELKYTKDIRGRIVNTLIKDGIPTDPKLLAPLLTTLSDMDRTTLTKMRIKTDNKLADNQMDTNAIITKLLTSVKVSALAVSGDSVRQISADLPSIEIVPGEIDIGTINSTYEEFEAVHFKLS